LRAIADLHRLARRILVSLGDRRLKTEDGIEVWPLDAFLWKRAIVFRLTSLRQGSGGLPKRFARRRKAAT
jgi:hypothetical protein